MTAKAESVTFFSNCSLCCSADEAEWSSFNIFWIALGSEARTKRWKSSRTELSSLPIRTEAETSRELTNIASIFFISRSIQLLRRFGYRTRRFRRTAHITGGGPATFKTRTGRNPAVQSMCWVGPPLDSATTWQTWQVIVDTYWARSRLARAIGRCRVGAAELVGVSVHAVTRRTGCVSCRVDQTRQLTQPVRQRVAP